MKPVFAKKAARPDPELLTLKAELLEAQGEELFLNEYLNSLMDGGTSPANELLIPGKKEQ